LLEIKTPVKAVLNLAEIAVSIFFKVESMVRSGNDVLNAED